MVVGRARPGVLLVTAGEVVAARFIDLGMRCSRALPRRVVRRAGPWRFLRPAQFGPEFAPRGGCRRESGGIRQPSWLVTHSAAFAAALALSNGLDARRAVLLAPSANPDSYTAQFAAVLAWTIRSWRRWAAGWSAGSASPGPQ